MFARFREKIKLRGEAVVYAIYLNEGEKNFKNRGLDERWKKQCQPRGREKVQTQFLPLNGGKKVRPLQFRFSPSIHPPPSLVFAICSRPSSRLCPLEFSFVWAGRTSAPRKKVKRGRGRKGGELVVVSMRRFVGIAGRYAGRISSMING